MHEPLLSEADAERIIGLPKRLIGQVKWRKRDGGHWIMEQPVTAPEQLPLRLYGRVNPRTGQYTFILFYGNVNLRRLDVGKYHHNPECDHVGPIHKHTWTDRFRDKWAYELLDPKEPASMQEYFLQFLTQCNITLEGQFTTPLQEGGKGR